VDLPRSRRTPLPPHTSKGPARRSHDGAFPRFPCGRCYISLSMSIKSIYRRMPDSLAIPLALLVSAATALALAILGEALLDSLLGKLLHRSGDLGLALLIWFRAAPSIAILAFVFCFSILVNWHHPTSWRTATFAFALVAILLWVWARDFGGMGYLWYAPGVAAFLVCCWFLHRKSISHSEHVLQA
jgi:hypothetical protein